MKQTKRSICCTCILFLCFLMLFISGCNVQTAEELSNKQASSSISIYSESHSEQVASSQQPVLTEELPQQVSDYLEQIKESSIVATVNPKGELVRQVNFPDLLYLNGRLSPDGKYMHCKKDSGGAGEARWSDYAVVNLETEKSVYYGQEQGGFNNHVILDNNLIGYAGGAPNEIWDGSKWEPIKIFDSNYKPLDVTLDFNFGKVLTSVDSDDYYENYITGIGYDKEKQRYILTYAQELVEKQTQNDFHHFSNRLGIAIFNNTGELLENRLLPEEYMAPTSSNLMMVLPQNPRILKDNWLLLGAHYGIDNLRKSSLIMVNLSTWEIKKHDYSEYLYRLFEDENVVFASESYREVDQPANVLLKIDNGDVISTTTLPTTISVDGFSKEFHLIDVAMKNNTVYVLASYWTDDNQCFNGLFYLNDNKMNLIHLLASSYEKDEILGVDLNGNCLILMSMIRDDV